MSVLLAGCGQQDVRLPGTHLGATPAQDFRLTDQEGRTLALSDLRGRAVVLTFLYTSCPDFCPLMAVKLRQTLERLGKDAGRVAVVAVSVDPERDTIAAAAEFTRLHQMPAGQWYYLVGREEELAPVWAAYGIAREPRPPMARPVPGASASDLLGHTEALYVLDTMGRKRTLLRGDFDPAQLATALRQLVR